MCAERRRACLVTLGLLTLLAACARHNPGPAKSRGERLYVNNCLVCHQANGEGVKSLQPPLAGTPVPNGDPKVFAAWVMFGLRPAALPRGQYSGVMPQFSFLSDQDLAELLSYVRSSFGNQAGPVSADTIAAVRAAQR